MNQKDLEKYKKTINETKKILKYENDLRKKFGNRRRELKEVLKIMEKQMEALAEGEKEEPTNEEKTKVKKVVNYFLEIASTKPIDSYFRDLSRKYLLVAFNWNKALGRNGDIERQIKATNAIVEGHISIMKAVEVLKKLIKEAKDTSSYRPPSFDLSRHYLKSLQDEASGKKGTKRTDEGE